MGNIIIFPNKKNSGLPNTVDQAFDQIDDARTIHIDKVLEFIMPTLVDMIKSNGLLLNEAKLNDFDMFIMEETIKSVLYRYSDLFHPLQDHFDLIYDNESESEEPDDNI